MKQSDEPGGRVGDDAPGAVDLAAELGAIRAAAETEAAEPYGGNKPAAEIESDIARTRANISETLDALERRLAPRHLLERGIDMVQNTLKGHGEEVGATVSDALRANPIPVALIGAGIGWLVLSNTSYGRSGGRSALRYSRSLGRSVTGALGSAAESVTDTAGRWVGQARDAVTETAGRWVGQESEKVTVRDTYAYARTKTAGDAARTGGAADAGGAVSRATEAGSAAYRAAGDYASRAGDYASRAGEQAGDYAGQVGRQASALGDRLGQVMEDYPLAVGALGFLAGALIAAALPSTRVENEWVGETSDEVWDQAREAGREALDRVQKVASTAAGAAVDAASDAARQTADSAMKEAERQGLMPSGDNATSGNKPGASGTASSGGSQEKESAGQQNAGSQNQT
jgi:Protein of unknown function (DUF3618)